MKNLFKSIFNKNDVPVIRGQYIDISDDEMPNTFSQFVALYGLSTLYKSQYMSPSSESFPAIVKEVDKEAVDLVTKGEIVKAFMITDSAKSTFFHSDLLRRQTPSIIQDALKNAKINAVYSGYTSYETLLGFNAFGTSRVLVSYYLAQHQLIIFMLGMRKGKPYVCGFVDPNLNTLLFNTYSHYIELISSKSSIYPNPTGENQEGFNKFNKILLALAFANGAVQKLALDQFDSPDSLFISPHSFLHALPMHYGIIGSSASSDTFERFKEVHFTPSLGILASKSAANLTPWSTKNSASRLSFVIDENLRSGKAEKELLQVLTSATQPLGSTSFSQPRKDCLEGDKTENLWLLHFSCHGSSSMDKWEESNLVMQDGFITANDILNRVNLESCMLTVLSACETGLLLDMAPNFDRYSGLDMAFWISGSDSVVSTFWSVQETATFIFNFLFYHATLFEKVPPPRAFILAIRVLREGFWKIYVQERLDAMNSGRWPAESSIFLKPVFEKIITLPEDTFSNVVYWVPFKYLGF